MGFRGPGPQQDKYRRQSVSVRYLYLALSEMDVQRTTQRWLMPLNWVDKKIINDEDNDGRSQFNEYRRL